MKLNISMNNIINLIKKLLKFLKVVIKDLIKIIIIIMVHSVKNRFKRKNLINSRISIESRSKKPDEEKVVKESIPKRKNINNIILKKII